MFVHLVLFRIQKKDVPVYKADCRIWEKEASRHAGFLGYHTLQRTNEPGQYSSFYLWKSETFHKRFMKKHHDRLVSLSHCPVKVLGYYNFKKL
jgi:heme-degrading monooxygenase HmoA